MTDETAHIAPAAAALDDPYAAPQPAPDREALVGVILGAMLGRYPGREMARAVADALLASGLRLPALADPYAALSQHLHGDGDWPGPGEKPHRYSPDPMLMGDCRVCGHTASAHEAPTCATPGCTNPPAILLDDRRLCRGCYATHDFGDNA